MVQRWFIINEWLFHDLWGENGFEQKVLSIHFLEAFLNEPDGIVVLNGSPWVSKAWQWMNRPNNANLAERQLSNAFFRMLFLDLGKSRFLQANEVNALPERLRQLLDANTIDASDEYLFQTWYSAPDDISVEFIVTSDCKLIESLAVNWDEVKTCHRNEFLNKYPELPSRQ